MLLQMQSSMRGTEQSMMSDKTGDTSRRLNQFIASCGLCSRREADRLIEEGRVLVDGKRAVPGLKVTKENRILVDGKPLSGDEPPSMLIAVNKPPGYVCTTDRRWGDKLLCDLVKSPVRVFHMGRLDKDSEGLILMTNQGDLLNRIMKAGMYHEKEYLVKVDRKISKDFLKKLSEGVYLQELDVTTRPCTVTMESPYCFRIILTQGLNRQIRRMCSAFGYHVRELKRVRIMNILLGDLPAGKWRMLTADETKELYRQLGMPEG